MLMPGESGPVAWPTFWPQAWQGEKVGGTRSHEECKEGLCSKDSDNLLQPRLTGPPPPPPRLLPLHFHIPQLEGGSAPLLLATQCHTATCQKPPTRFAIGGNLEAEFMSSWKPFYRHLSARTTSSDCNHQVFEGPRPVI